MQTLNARAIAAQVGGQLVGNPDVTVTGVAALGEAEPGQLSFLGNARYTAQVLPSRAGIVLVPKTFALAPPAGRAFIFCADPSAAFDRCIAAFAPPPPPRPAGVHPTAWVDPSARVAASAHVGPLAIVMAGATIGERSIIEGGCYLGEDVRVGADCHFYPQVVVRERCLIGNQVILNPGVIIGGDGFGFIPGRERHTKIPQVGIVRIDDDVELGANTTVDRARFGVTWIRRGAKIDNLVQIGHNVEIGELSFLVAQSGIAGSAKLGKGVQVAGQSGIVGHITVGDGAKLVGRAGVTKDVPAGETWGGTPARPQREFMRVSACESELPDLVRRVRQLEAHLAELKRQLPPPAGQ